MSRAPTDGLVGATAARHGLRLAARDRGATDTYRLLDVDLEILA
jgi:predicted nucleic acid-binding protein